MATHPPRFATAALLQCLAEAAASQGSIRGPRTIAFRRTADARNQTASERRTTAAPDEATHCWRVTLRPADAGGTQRCVDGHAPRLDSACGLG